MAHVVVTFTDDPTGDGSVNVVSVPPMAALFERIAVHGERSLTGAETFAVSALAHVLRTAQAAREVEHGGLVMPGGFRA